MGDHRGISRRARWAILVLSVGFCLLTAAPCLQARSAVVHADRLPENAVLVLLAGAAEADRRTRALGAVCTLRSKAMTLLVGDDDEVEDVSGRAWGPLLVDRISTRYPGCFLPRLVTGRVRTTQEELEALDDFLSQNAELQGLPIVFVTSPFHRARVALGASKQPMLQATQSRFLFVPESANDYAPLMVAGELARVIRDTLGLGDLFGRRTIDNLRERTPWARPKGAR